MKTKSKRFRLTMMTRTSFAAIVLAMGLGTQSERSILAQTPEAPAGASGEQKSLVNADVIQMVDLGLDADVIIAKIKNSTVAFDVSTTALVELKKAGVTSDIASIMIERPNGPPSSLANAAPGKPQPTATKVTSIRAVKRVYVKAPTEVLRSTAEKELKDNGGPGTVLDNGEYEGVLVIGVDCGEQTLSLWTGANYCTCEATMTLESGGERLWSTTDHERAANAPRAGKYMVERMIAAFVQAWRSTKP